MPLRFDWWDEHRAHITSPPSRAGLHAMADAVAPGARPVRYRRLHGGIATATSVVTLREKSGRTKDVVIKRFRDDRAQHATFEFKRLAFARRLSVPSPEPLRVDPRGEWFGVPALVMTKLPGRPDIEPGNVQRWMEAIADVQVRIHSHPTGRVPAVLRAPIPKHAWKPPDGLRHTALVRRALEVIRRGLPRALRRDIVVGHGDAHPGNLLWQRGGITGVTDWQGAHLYPRGREVAYTRTDTAVLLGPRAADEYLAVYERHLGRPVVDLAVWDLMQGLNAMRWSPLWAFAYREQGASLSDELARSRAVAFVRRALKRLPAT